MAVDVSIPKAVQADSESFTFATGTPVVTSGGATIVIPVQVQDQEPIAVFAGTSTISPKKIIPSTPLKANIRAGSVISGGSFAGTEVVSAVTKNSQGLITEITYTGTGSVNASAANFTVTDTEYDPTLYFIRLTHTGKGSALNIKAELLPLPGSSSSENSGSEAATVSSASVLGKAVEHDINFPQWKRDLGFSDPV